LNGFALWVGFGAVLGLWRVVRSAPQRQADVWVNIGLWLLFASLIGARLFYVWINRDYFIDHLVEIPQLWQGGLAWPGAAGAAWLALIYLAVTYRTPRGSPVSLGWLSDHLYPLLPSLSITTWLGCWASNSAYGPALPAGSWWGIRSLDESGTYVYFWPLQPLASLSLLAFFWLLETRVKPLRPPGRLSVLGCFGVLLHLLVTSLLRADPAPTWNRLRVDAWMALIYLGGLITLVIIYHLILRIWRKPTFLNLIDS